MRHTEENRHLYLTSHKGDRTHIDVANKPLAEGER